MYENNAWNEIPFSFIEKLHGEPNGTVSVSLWFVSSSDTWIPSFTQKNGQWFHYDWVENGRKESFLFSLGIVCTLHINRTQYEISSNVADAQEQLHASSSIEKICRCLKFEINCAFCTHSNWFNFWFRSWVIILLWYCQLDADLRSE